MTTGWPGFRLVQRLGAAAVAISTVGCSSPTMPVLPTPTGHFIGPAFAESEPRGLFFALSLRQPTGTTISGTGWIHSGTTPPVVPLLVSGTYDALRLDLQLARTSGIPYATFQATVTDSGLRGEWVHALLGRFPVHLARVDTNAAGTYQAILGGAITANVQEAAGFVFVGPPTSAPGTLLLLDWPGFNGHLLTVQWPDSIAGSRTYTVAPNGVVAFIQVYDSAGGYRSFGPARGTITVDVGSAYAMIGRLALEAAESGIGEKITLQARFSAGCFGRSCRP